MLIKHFIITSSLFIGLTCFAQQKIKTKLKNNNTTSIRDSTSRNKMKIEIWSDITCPFCYIGKRNLETALAQFEHRNEVEIIWKSFQLDPSITYQPNQDVYTYLAEKKGFPKETAISLSKNVTEMAKSVGLTYNFDIAVINNSFDAHRLIQFAKTKNLGDEMEERLFKAYFTEGKNIGDHKTLIELGFDIGLLKTESEKVLSSNQFSQEVKNDIIEANQLEVRGVPFFVMDRKFAVSGAQEVSAFLNTLNKSYAAWKKENPGTNMNIINGAVCTPEGECK